MAANGVETRLALRWLGPAGLVDVTTPTCDFRHLHPIVAGISMRGGPHVITPSHNPLEDGGFK